METQVSIDNLSLVAKGEFEFRRLLELSPDILYAGVSRNYQYQHAYKTLDGTFIEHGKENAVRIEFNPNKADKKIIDSVLRTIHSPRLTRMDIAVDYFGQDLGACEWESKKPRESKSYFSKDGVLETRYIGASTSQRQYRIYNKLKERQDKNEKPDPRALNGHWRVELQQRYKASDDINIREWSDYFYDDFFKDIYAKYHGVDLSFIDSTMDRIVVQGLLTNPTEIDGLAKGTKAKYRKLIREAKERGGIEDIEPYEVYEKEKAQLVSRLEEQMGKTMQLLKKDWIANWQTDEGIA